MLLRIGEYRRIGNGGPGLLFAVDTCAIYRPDEILLSILDLFGGGASTRDAAVDALTGPFARGEVEEAMDELLGAGLLRPDGEPAKAVREPSDEGELELPPFSHLVMSVSHVCNLRCRYCYAGGGSYGGAAVRMEPGMAVDLVDFLLERSADERVMVTFFGGEPLLNLEAVRAAVARGRKRSEEIGREIDFALTTNGTLLDEPTVRFLSEAGIRLTVSIDGPEAVHDRNRTFLDGSGSYGRLVSRLPGLVERCRIPARVTLTRENLHVVGILDHLVGLGFTEVGFAPVDSCDPDLALGDAEMERMMEGFERLTARFLREALGGRVYGFSNAVNLMKLLHQGDVKPLPCGAGLKLAAASPDGSFSICHRFVGNGSFGLGSLRDGVDEGRRRDLLWSLRVDEKPACRACWGRHLCGGGCYYLADLHNGDPREPHAATCAFLLRWYEFGVGVYAKLKEENPGFLDSLAGTELDC